MAGTERLNDHVEASGPSSDDDYPRQIVKRGNRRSACRPRCGPKIDAALAPSRYDRNISLYIYVYGCKNAKVSAQQDMRVPPADHRKRLGADGDIPASSHVQARTMASIACHQPCRHLFGR
jgi:hypothetical protein